MSFSSVENVSSELESVGYIPSRQISTVVYLAQATNKPMLVEGPAGVGKTELAKSVALCLGRELIRLQCYEGLDEAKALYEWEYAKQLLYTQMVKEKIGEVIEGAKTLSEAVDRIAGEEDAFFSERFICSRPLLKAISSDEPTVLLIDEVDKSDPEFEAFLLELLSDFQVTIPEIGTRKAKNIPFVVLTSNNYRDMSDALKRRCLHMWIDYPDREIEKRIVKTRIPGIEERLLDRMIDAVREIRKLELRKRPCISETLDWARALIALQVEDLSADLVADTLGALIKYKTDADRVNENMVKILKD